MNNSGKTHGCLIAVIVVLLVVILAMAAIFIIFFARRADTPDVDEILAEVENSERTTDNDSSLTDVINIQSGEQGGVTEISMSLTNADLTALANDYADSSDDLPFNSLLLNCNEDETIDITGVIEDLSIYADGPDVPAILGAVLKSAEGKRLYATIFITYRGGNDFEIAFENIRIEKFNVPIIDSLFGPMADDIESMLQDQLDSYDQFSLEEFEVEEDLLTFKGELSE